jgi:hypothetical protein
VYNTATAGSGSTAVTPGYYYWNGTKWVAFGGTNGKDWSLTGNAGTAIGTNFLGTTDNVALQFRTNNVQSGLIDGPNYETFFGYNAGLNTTGIINSFFGYNSGQATTSGTGNTAAGYNSLYTNSTGTDNTAIGVQALYSTTGSSNVALGTNAGYSLSSGGSNTALGFYAINNGSNTSSGSNNTAVGNRAVQNLTTGGNNTGTGNQALQLITSGSYNTAIGSGAGSVITSGSYNTALGYQAGASTATFSNSTALGAYAQAGASDALILGSISGVNGATSSAKVGIGTTTPSDALVVKVPSSSAINCITADVTAGDGTGNALYAVSAGKVGYSAIYTANTPVMTAGTGFDITTSHHSLGAQINLPSASPFTPSYGFAIHGEVSGHSNPCGGVLGYYATAAVWGALGYRNSGGTANYGMYATSGAIGAASLTTSAAARQAGLSVGDEKLMNIGLAAYGDLFGAWARGNIYGMAIKGEKVSLYVDGQTVVNKPIVQITRNEDKTTIHYLSASATPDLQVHGVANLEKGAAAVQLDQDFLSQFSATDDLTVIVTPKGATNGVYASVDNGKLLIQENGGGLSNVKVSWIVIGKRAIEPIDLPAEMKDPDFDKKLNNLMTDENKKEK